MGPGGTLCRLSRAQVRELEAGGADAVPAWRCSRLPGQRRARPGVLFC